MAIKKIKAYSVRVKSIKDVSDKAVLIESFDGRKDIFPNSQIFANDYDVEKSIAIWVAAWILEKKDIQFSRKKIAWFNELGEMLPRYQIKKHVPENKEAVATKPNKALIR